MRTRLPPNVERNRVKNRNYFYFRVGKGARIRLPDDIHSEEFRAAYAAAMAGGERKPRGPKQDAPGTIGWLVASYLRSAAWESLKETSKPGYMSRLNRIREDHGHRTVSGMNRGRIITMMLEPFADYPGARLDTLKKLRILIRHAIDIGILKHDPSLGIKRPKTKEIRAWTDTEMERFERRWPIGTKERTAYELMLNIGTSRVDVHKITWKQLEDGARYSRSKTGVEVQLDLTERLKAALAAAPREHVTVINSGRGAPFKIHSFSRFMRDAMKAAGLPMDCKPHGLRKTLGRHLADAGVSTHDIMATLGHTTLAQAENYTREANRRRGGERAVAKLNDHNANKTPQTNLEDLGKRPENTGKSK
jgi:enterobacteria phage integrase